MIVARVSHFRAFIGARTVTDIDRFQDRGRERCEIRMDINLNASILL